MKYAAIDSNLFIKNRTRYRKEVCTNSLSLFNSNDIMPTNGDGMMDFRQNSDLFHLSGIDQEESILLLFPEAINPDQREILFLKETNAQIAIWEGEKLTKEKAFATSGIQNIYWLQEFEEVLDKLMYQVDSVYLNTNEHLRAKVEVETRDARFGKWIRKTYSKQNFLKSAPIMHKIRAIKETTEIQLIQKACKLTESGFRKILKTIKPGVMEYEIEAEIIHEFIRNRSRGFAYTPILASGASACVLHYIDNNKECKDGDVILMDFGAEYANYASDMTRCVPVNGKFSPRQKEVYNAVLRVMKAATKMLIPGTFLKEYHIEVGRLMEKELIVLGLISQQDIDNQSTESPAYKKYFMHGTSHYLGLDVHDVGSWEVPMESGMVFTCEPGIYIPDENLGIRLENDILVTDDGPIDLMSNIPLEIDEIEALMRR
jgi:Xaa-Pro aminopeptidase